MGKRGRKRTWALDKRNEGDIAAGVCGGGGRNVFVCGGGGEVSLKCLLFLASTD